ncbi:MAG TPA: cytochrome c oxidase assembly protein [Stellaceae bacterium]|nr:cytochrome c oxidase assembly protein [Stellaceae bacterium]
MSRKPQPRARRGKGATVLGLFAIIGAMSALVAFSVPLYRLFCAATGYNGTTQRAAAAPDNIVKDRVITVRLNADVAPGLDWEFRPEQASVKIHPGETAVVHYRAANFSKQAEIGTATFNVTPDKAGPYFDKLQCFCFTEQHLGPGQSADLAVQFFVDPDIVKNPNSADVDTITLSYTMFRARGGAAAARTAVLPATASAN